VSFIILAFISRILLPFADEPDWTVRAPLVLFGDHPFWSPYFILSDFLKQLNINSDQCIVNAAPMSLWAHIPTSCNEDISQVLVRLITMIFILLPLFYILVFKKNFIRLMNFVGVKVADVEWDLRINAIALSLVFPGVLYYLGVLAEEQFFLVVALYVFLFWGFWKIIFALILVLLTIDFGNSLVLIFFVLSMFFFMKLRALSRNLYFWGLSFYVLFALIVGYRFVEFFLQLGFLTEGIVEKSEAIFNALDGSELLNKYPIFLRPVVTFMSFVFMTPSGVKVPFIYLLFFLYFIFVSIKVLKTKSGKIDVYWFVPLTVIVFFIFLFPTYGNAKYYIFMMPFFVYTALAFYDSKKILMLFSFSTLLVFLSIFLYRF
jgi:hypothetical protein